MRHNVSVKIPQRAGFSYTAFAQGLKIATPEKDSAGNFITFKFLGGTVFAVFYTFAEFRRAYLVTDWESEMDGERIFLPGIETPLCLVWKAKGRKIDDLKRALYWLAEKDGDAAFRLPLPFWQKLSRVLQNGGAKKSEVLYLHESCQAVEDR